MTKNDFARILQLPKDEPAAPKVDRLAAYAQHRINWWHATADLLAWRAGSIPEMTAEEQTLHLRSQLMDIIGSQELA